MVAGSVGEIAACWVRVPTENVKQKLQAGVYPRMTECVRGILAEGGASGFYVGCASAPPPRPRAAQPCRLRRSSGVRKSAADEAGAPLAGADLTTVMREIPFSAIQFPLYEGMKKRWGEAKGSPVNSLQAALCGSVAGGFAVRNPSSSSCFCSCSCSS